MKNKVLFVVTSHSELASSGRKTGFFLSEVTHPWSVISTKYEIDIISPKGGRPPIDGFNLNDEINQTYWNDPEWQDQISNTLTPDKVNADDYAAIFFAGGHGAMWDFPNNPQLSKLASDIYNSGGVIAAVCHGPAALLDIKLLSGEYLVKGKKLDAFTNAEEDLNGTTIFMPFRLQSALEDKGAVFDCDKPWTDHVVADGRLITGQNPQSALDLGKKLLEVLAITNN